MKYRLAERRQVEHRRGYLSRKTGLHGTGRVTPVCSTQQRGRRPAVHRSWGDGDKSILKIEREIEESTEELDAGSPWEPTTGLGLGVAVGQKKPLELFGSLSRYR